MNKDIYIIVEGGEVQQVFLNPTPMIDNTDHTAIVINVDKEALETADTRTLIADHVAGNRELDEMEVVFPNYVTMKAEILLALEKQL